MFASGSSGGGPWNDYSGNIDTVTFDLVGSPPVIYDFENAGYVLAFGTQPSNTSAGAPVTPSVTVEIRDSGGNVVTGATDDITLAIGTNPSAGTLSGTLTVAAVAGVATFPGLSINNVGTGYTLTASATGLATVPSNTFDITGVSLVFNPNPPFAAADCLVNTTIVVEIRDALNAVVGSATNAVTLTLTSGTGAISGTLLQNAVAGIATFNDVQFSTSGAKQVTASATGFTNVASAAFNIQETLACPPPPTGTGGTGTGGTGTDGSGVRLLANGIAVVASANGASFGTPGGNATWTFIIQNVSGGQIDNITARVTYPDDDMVGVNATSDKGINGAFSRGSLLTDYAIGTLGAGDSVTLTITTQLPNRGGIFSGFLVVSVGGAPEADALLSISTITSLPSTGETPLWATLLRQALAILSVFQTLR